MSTEWPKQGSCGACGRPAEQVPSGKWWHRGVPCRARSQDMWRVDDLYIRDAVRFVPEGEPLPVEPEKWHTHVTETTADGFPVELALCTADHMSTVREFLAAEAEGREAS